MKVSKGMMAGLGIASLLIALPAGAQSSSGGTSGSSGSSGSSSGSSGSASSPSKSQSGSSGSMGGTGSGSSSSDTSSGSSGSMGSGSGSAMGGGSSHVTGKVEKFDQTKNQLSLQLKVSDSTQVMKDGRTASLSDIKEGDQVRASLSATGQVQRIDVMSGGGSGSYGSGSSSGTGTGSGSGTGSGMSPGTGTGTSPGTPPSKSGKPASPGTAQ